MILIQVVVANGDLQVETDGGVADQVVHLEDQGLKTVLQWTCSKTCFAVTNISEFGEGFELKFEL